MTLKTISQKLTNRLPQESEQSQLPKPRKHDQQIAIARQQPAWLAFEAGIHQDTALRARIARSLHRYGLGSSSAMVDEALDFLIHKDLGANARFFKPARPISVPAR